MGLERWNSIPLPGFSNKEAWHARIGALSLGNVEYMSGNECGNGCEVFCCDD